MNDRFLIGLSLIWLLLISPQKKGLRTLYRACLLPTTLRFIPFIVTILGLLDIVRAE